MAAPSAMTATDDNTDLFPSLEQETHSILLELYNNPDKLHDYFAEQPSTKELLRDNSRLQQSNLEQAESNMITKKRVEQMISDLQRSIDELEEAKKELKTMAMLAEEAEQRNSFDAVMQSLSSEVAKTELELSRFRDSTMTQENVNYQDHAQVMLRLYQKIHESRFAMEWIDTNCGVKE